ncbi:DUF2958 domain-containing protein [Clostridium formicaceticum]|uniref:DUF2958 domain-containing protein n=1 Tax=Clostridium formicaceticum TaxID=1497 RepID=A0AAC9RL66_9CLOT|nr:DUF2958 domain-containing protein [Clostridium formicaceticum]AOY74747.1 hypothetical protein BJL90_01520 [Clostridium formicaceticum]ARE89134.1 hypothetical protein CLFO_35400 [Clostridium formicaceticum]
MKLLSDELKEKFVQNPLYSTEGIEFHEKKILAHFFNPIGAGDWYITEGNYDPKTNDVLMFGYGHLGDDQMAEWGFVTIKELEDIKLPLGFKIERDFLYDGNHNFIINDVAKVRGLGLTYVEPDSKLAEIKGKGTRYEKNPISKSQDKEKDR